MPSLKIFFGNPFLVRSDSQMLTQLPGIEKDKVVGLKPRLAKIAYKYCSPNFFIIGSYYGDIQLLLQQIPFEGPQKEQE